MNVKQRDIFANQAKQGYGDVVPETVLGKMIGASSMVVAGQ